MIYIMIKAFFTSVAPALQREFFDRVDGLLK